MATELQIVNRALIEIGENTIDAFADSNKRARAANAVKDTVREGLLGAFVWKFAIDRSTEASDGTPANTYSNFFNFKADWLFVFEVEGVWIDGDIVNQREFKNRDYLIEGRTVLANQSSVKVRAVKDETDTTNWHPVFTDAYIAAVAVTLCEHLSQSQEKREFMKRDWAMAMQRAIFGHAIEFPPNTTPEAQWAKFMQAYLIPEWRATGGN